MFNSYNEEVKKYSDVANASQVNFMPLIYLDPRKLHHVAEKYTSTSTSTSRKCRSRSRRYVLQ